MKEIKYLVWLAMVFGSTSEKVWEILKEYSTAYEAYSELSSGACSIRLTESQKKNVQKITLEKAEETIMNCVEKGINILGFNSPAYPERLRRIKCPPPVIYYMGNISCISQENNISCVGTRDASRYTLNTVSRICTELAMNGFTIVSGFAVGCDITSHLSAVGASRPTVCVLGCGIDINYPPQNKQYRNDILRTGGVFISEFPPNTPAYASNFPQRNRIIAGLSRATIVFEAGARSGSLSTANLVRSQKGELFCLPPTDLFDSRYSGNIKLLRSTAKPLYSVQDIFDFYGTEKVSCFSENKTPPDIKKKIKSTAVKPEEHRKSSPEEKAVSDVNEKPEKHEIIFTPVQQKILEMLDIGAVHVDVIIQKFDDMDISEIITEIMELQIAGIIEEIAGSRYRKC
ncbi:MAG: DNA-processing protein DprA [Ruminococcus flavefaciens]|nr:DNA-processing protein DprA [Ruminococcus flavefaciens]